MAQAKGNSALTAENLREISGILRHADKLVKNGEFKEALQKIKEAQIHEINNPFTQAYFNRLRYLLSESEKRKSDKPLRLDKEQIKINEKIVQLAIEDAERQVSIIEKQKSISQLLEKDIEEKNKQEEVRRSIIREKIEKLLVRVQEYRDQGDYKSSIEELDRILIIDPSNSEVKKLKELIRTEQDEIRKFEEAKERREREELERRKVELLGQELSRIREEFREHQKKEEEKRRLAKEKKIKEHIQKTRELLTNQHYEEALNEIAQAIILDPVYEEAIDLERKIREKQEKVKEEEEKLFIKQKEEEDKKQENNKRQIQKYLSKARSLSREQKYFDALQIVSQAYVLNPMDEEITACENEIIELQDNYNRLRRDEQNRKKEEQEKSQEEEMRQMIEAERNRLLQELLQSKDSDLEDRRKRFAEYLQQAQQYLKEERYEDALGEMVSAFIIDPFSEEIAEIEKKIMQALAKKKEGEKVDYKGKIGLDGKKTSDTVKQERDKKSEVAEYISEIKRLKKNGEFEKALERFAEAVVMDPSHRELKALGWQVRQEYEEYKRAQEIRDSISRHIISAREYIEQNRFEDAEQEIILGLVIDESNKELLRLKSEIDELLESHRKNELEEHIKNAKHFIRQDLLDDALMEIARGLNIDPTNERLFELEKKVEKKRKDEYLDGYDEEEAVPEETGYEAMREYISTAEKYLLDGKFDDASRILKKASRIDPTDQSVKELMNWIEQEKSGAVNSRSSLRLLFNRRRSAG